MERLRALGRRLAQEPEDATGVAEYVARSTVVDPRPPNVATPLHDANACGRATACVRTPPRSASASTNGGPTTVASLRREIESLQEELRTYRSTEWRSSSLPSMGPHVPGEFAHQQGRLTVSMHDLFSFKGVITVSNRYHQVRPTRRRASGAG